MTTPPVRHTFASGAVLVLLEGDLTQASVDAIVNAAGAHLAHGGGVAGAIVRQGGVEIQRESDAWVRRHGPIAHDRPALTGAGRLPCRKIIHALGPIWGQGDEDARLHAAFVSSLRLAHDNGFTRIAFPAISTGVFGFPIERAAEVSLRAIADYFEAHPESSVREVQVVLVDRPSFDVFARAHNRVWPPARDAA
jgi:putative ATPase